MATTPNAKPRTARGARTTAASKAAASPAEASAANNAAASGGLVCPECGRVFERAAALGSHRKRMHGVAGLSASAKAAKKGRGRAASAGRGGRTRITTSGSGGGTTTSGGNGLTTGVDRDALLAGLFPNGVPPRESVIREVAQWLDQAERLAKLR
jgi:hypothetical protein